MATGSLGAAGAFGIFGLIRWLRGYQNRLIFLPDKYPNGIWETAEYGLPADDVWFEAEDGVRLHGWWIPHRKDKGTVLFFHGNGGSLGHRIGVLSHLRRIKANFLAIDYRGYGRSDGEPTEKGVYRDAIAAYDFLVGELGESPERIVLFGHSLGGAIAVECALRRRVAGIVVQSSLTDTRSAAEILFPYFPARFLALLARRKFCSIDKVPSLQIPKLFVHGEEDGSLPIEFSRRLFEAASEPKEFYAVPRAGHNDIYRHGGLKYLRLLSRFRDRCIR